MAEWTNWAKTVRHPDLAKVYDPKNLAMLKDNVAEAVENGWKLRAVGSGHAWSNLGLPPGRQGAVILTDRLQGFEVLKRPSGNEPGLVEVEAGIKIKRLTELLFDADLALPNIGDANPQGLGGAIATSTHGSGVGPGLGSFSEAIEGMTIVTVDEQGRVQDRILQDEQLKAGRVARGQLGVVYKVKLAVIDNYYLDHVRTIVEFRKEETGLPALLRDNRHVEYWFYPYTEPGMAERIVRNVVDSTKVRNPLGPFERLRIKFASWYVNRLGRRSPERLPNLFRKRVPRLREIRRQGPWHKILLGSSNIWREVVKTYTMEYQFAYEHLWEAFGELEKSIALAERNGVYVAAPIQFRFTKKSERSFLSHLSFEPTVSFSISFHTNHRGAHKFLPDVEERLIKLGGKPHWGKMYYTRPAEDPRFEAVREQLDPTGVFAYEQPLPEREDYQNP